MLAVGVYYRLGETIVKNTAEGWNLSENRMESCLTKLWSISRGREALVNESFDHELYSEK